METNNYCAEEEIANIHCARTTIDVLNDLADKDKASVTALLNFLHPTNKKVLDKYDIKMQGYEYPKMGVLTILNKIIEGSGKRIKVKWSADPYTESFVLEGFELEDR